MNLKLNLILFLIVFFSSPTISEEIRLTITGSGITEDEAVKDAQRNALRKSYGEFISTNLTILNNELTKNETVNLVSGTIKNYKVLSKTINNFSEPPLIEVLIDTTVNKGELITFAKSIGDNVQVQGSLFGAEISRIEQNKNNEVIAMQHLYKKATQMSSFFDYELEVGEPKQSIYNENNYVIDVMLKLKPNQNYINLLQAIKNTISELAIRVDEEKKFNELGVPYYKIDILNIVQPNCLNIYPFNYGRGHKGLYSNYPIIEFQHDARFGYMGNPDNKKDFQELYKSLGDTEGLLEYKYASMWDSHHDMDITCRAGNAERYLLRNNKSKEFLAKINNVIFQSIVNYEVFRQTKTGQDILIPKGFTPSSFNSTWGGEFQKDDRHAWRYMRELGSTAIANLIMRHLPAQNRTERIYRNMEVSLAASLDISNDSSKVFDIGDSSKFMFVEGSKFPIGGGEPIHVFKKSVQIGFHKCSSTYERDFNSIPGTREICYSYEKLSSSQVVYDGIGAIHIFPSKYSFAELYFEDIVSSEYINKITAYIVDPDKPTKQRGLYD